MSEALSLLQLAALGKLLSNSFKHSFSSSTPWIHVFMKRKTMQQQPPCLLSSPHQSLRPVKHATSNINDTSSISVGKSLY